MRFSVGRAGRPLCFVQNIFALWSKSGARSFCRQIRHRQPGGQGAGIDEEMLTFLEENTEDVEYLLAVPSAQNGSTLVLQTGRPVLFMGGFSRALNLDAPLGWNKSDPVPARWWRC